MFAKNFINSVAYIHIFEELITLVAKKEIIVRSEQTGRRYVENVHPVNTEVIGSSWLL